jgi:DNA-directed RNA polymerase specialized sigma24 family protein
MHQEETRDAEDLRAVLGPILDNNKSRWLQFALAILKNEADAEDVIQEAICRVLARSVIAPNDTARNRPPLSRDQARMYLGRAIGNTALELYNSRKRERMRQIPIKEDLLVSSNTLNPYACSSRCTKDYLFYR